MKEYNFRGLKVCVSILNCRVTADDGEWHCHQGGRWFNESGHSPSTERAKEFCLAREFAITMHEAGK